MSTEEVSVRDQASRDSHFSLVGVGGAGNNLLSHAITRGINPEDCIAVSTDRGQLSESLAVNKVLLSDERDGQWSRKSIGNVDLLAHRVTPFTQQSASTILLAGLGGVTGTRTAPIIAELHRSRIRPVFSVVALPFIHERERRFVALRGLKRMVESCNCTVVVDNAVQHNNLANVERSADERAAMAVRGLTDIISIPSLLEKRGILETLSLGPVATLCVSSIGNASDIQSSVISALKSPSASLPVTSAEGVVIIYRGAQSLGAERAQRAYETVCSLLGKQVEFRAVNATSNGQATLSIFLTGYSYGTALGSFVDLIQDLYDMEYGLDCNSSEIPLPLGLYQMEN